MEKDRNGPLETVERKQQSRIGALEESQETIFQDMLPLDSMVSEVEGELREGGDELRRVTLEWRRTEAKGLRVMDVGGVGDNREAASDAGGSGCEVSSAGEPGVDVNRKGSLGSKAP